LYSDKVKVRAFEAQRNIYNMLCGTIAINGLVKNVYCHHNAVSNTDDETIEIALPDYGSPNRFGSLELIGPKNSDNQDMVKTHTEKIKTISIDSFEENIDFIKIDIEGMEDKALLGAYKTISVHKPICFIELLKTDKEFVINYFRNLYYVGYLKEIDLIAIPIEEFGFTGLERIF
jgi:FkbM family methyltransferase